LANGGASVSGFAGASAFTAKDERRRQDREGYLGVFAWRPWRFPKLFHPLQSN
jgi:hypothetical protein